MARQPDLERYPQKLRDDVKAEYMEFVPVIDIAKKHGIKDSLIFQWARNCGWYEERNAAVLEHRKDTITNLKRRFGVITKMALPAIQNSIAARLEKIKQHPLSILEIKQLSEVVWQWYDHMRVDEGLPTEIIHTKGALSQDEIIAILKKDKFFDIERVKDVTNSKSITGEVHGREGHGGDSGNHDASNLGAREIRADSSSDTIEGGRGPNGNAPSGGENQGPIGETSQNSGGGLQDSGGETSPLGSLESNVRDPFE